MQTHKLFQSKNKQKSNVVLLSGHMPNNKMFLKSYINLKNTCKINIFIAAKFRSLKIANDAIALSNPNVHLPQLF